VPGGRSPGGGPVLAVRLALNPPRSPALTGRLFRAVTGIAYLADAVRGTLAHSIEGSRNGSPLPKKTMVALIVFVVVLLAVAALVADYTVKARRKARLRREAAERLAAAASVAEAQERERRARQQASAALTSVMPTIHDRGPRRV
jgi:hypothetical protein